MNKDIIEQLKASIAEEILEKQKRICTLVVEMTENILGKKAFVKEETPMEKLEKALICQDEENKEKFFKALDEEFENALVELRKKMYNRHAGLMAEYLNNFDCDSASIIMKGIKEECPSLANEIKRQIFMFEDIAIMDDRSVQRMLRKIDTKKLTITLKNASEEVRDKIFHNMSKRAADMLQEDIELIAVASKEETENARQEILSIIRQLEEEGEILIPNHTNRKNYKMNN